MKSGEVKLFIGICVVALLLVGVAVYPMLGGQRDTGIIEQPTEVSIKRETLIPPWSRTHGDPNAPYTLVEFGDYQCASCAMGEFTVKELMQKHQGKLNKVFHHVQITPEHRWAPVLARAAAAAGEQNKFWEVHQEIFDNQARFKETTEERVMEILTDMAKKHKLDVVKFRADLTGPEVTKRVQDMEALAKAINLEATPTYYLVPRTGKVTAIGSNSQLEDFLASKDALK